MLLNTTKHWAILLACFFLSTPVHGQEQRWSLTEVLRVGSADGESALTRVQGVAATSDGRQLIVGQPLDRVVLVVDTQTGALVRVLGRQGGGPGEFQSITAVGVVGDTIFVMDLRQQRVVFFSAGTGAHIATTRIASPPLEDVNRPAFPVALTPAGGYWSQPAVSAMRIGNGMLDHVPIVLLASDGRIVKRVMEEIVAGTVSSAMLSGRVLVFFQPLIKPMVVSYSSDGSSAVSVSNRSDGRATVKRYDHRGTLVYERDLHFSPTPVPGEARDSLFDWFASLATRGGGSFLRARRIAHEHVVIPENYPPVTNVLVAQDGSAWLRLSHTHDWVVLGADGSRKGRVRIPPDLELLLPSEAHVWGVWRDPLDVPYLVRYRIRKDVRGPSGSS